MKKSETIKNFANVIAKNPMVSIVMPTYNVEEYLPDTLAGLTKQTFTNFEIIFVDDGSQDRTVELLRNFAAKDGRATVLQQEHQYAGAARNLGMRRARGKYLLFLDGDDFFAPQMLEKSVAKAEETGSDICVFRANRLDHETKEISEMAWMMRIDKCPIEKTFSIQTNAKRIFEFTTAAPWNKFYRRDFIIKYSLTFQNTRQANDIAFVFTSLALAEKISVINEDLQTHRFNNKKSLQGTNDKKPECFYDALKELKRRLVAYGVYNQIEPAFLNYIVEVSWYNLWTLRSVFSFEKTFNLIRDEIFTEFGIKNKPNDYFYAYYKTAERRNDLCSLSVYEFFNKWKKVPPESMYERTAVAVARKGLIPETDKKPKVSVIITCLNSMKYLEECLSSILRQTVQDIEVICVDAGSTDGTDKYIQNRAMQDSRISLVYSDQKSYGYQINLGIKQARGEFMALVDSDDYIVPDMYEKLYALAKRYSLEVVKSDFSRFYGTKENRTFVPASVLRDKKKYNQVKNVQADSDVFGAYVLITPAIYSLKFLRKHQIRANETPGASYQDNGFWFQVLMHAERMWFYPESLYMLRRDNPNSSVKSPKKVYAMCEENDFIRRLIGEDPERVRLFAPYAARNRFWNYNSTLLRIGDEYKLDFLIQFAKDFHKLRDAEELHGDLFTDKSWKILTEIMKDPVKYYLSEYYGANNYNEKSTTKEIDAKFKASIKKGSLRKLRGLFKCIKENGYTYTAKRIIEHCGIDMGTPAFKKRR